MSFGETKTADEKKALEKTDETYWQKAKKFYDESKLSDRDLPKEAKDWAKDDFNRIGDWEYKIVAIDISEIVNLEKQLNKLGEDRWECFWISEQPENLTLFFKKPKISYLQKMPIGDALKFFRSSE